MLSAHPSEEVKKLIVGIDSLLSPLMLIYFIVSLIRAPDKKQFMKWGWVILVASLPPIGFIKDVWNELQVLRMIIVIQFFYTNKHTTANALTNNLVNSMMIAFFIVLISTILVLHFEDVPEANIKTAGEAIYWAFVTISTVGCGVSYPVTTPGRFVIYIIIFSGVSIIVTA